jgi:drug/metabolite transporter (DMT)-like permease
MQTQQATRSHNKIKYLYFLLVFVMYGFFGISFVVGKKTLQYGGPFFLTGCRMLIASGILFLIQFCIDRKRMVWIKGVFLEILLLSLFNIFLTNVLEFWGLQYLSCYKTCYVYSLSPFLAAIISYFALKERLGKAKILGLVIALLGFVPLMVYKEYSETPKFYISPAEWALLGAVGSTVTGWVVMRRLVYQKNFPPLMANAYSMFIGGGMAFLTSWLFEGFTPVAVSNWHYFLYGMLIITLINNLIGYNLYAFLIRKFTVTLMSFIGFITPLITGFFGWLVLKEPMSLLFFISYLIVLVGFFIFSRQELLYNKK